MLRAYLSESLRFRVEDGFAKLGVSGSGFRGLGFRALDF